MGDKYLATWTSSGGKKRRKIGYIMINAKYWNAERAARSNPHWGANMNQNHQHPDQTMQLYYNAPQKYRTPIPSDPGMGLEYDIRELRIRPENSPIGTKNRSWRCAPPKPKYPL